MASTASPDRSSSHSTWDSSKQSRDSGSGRGKKSGEGQASKETAQPEAATHSSPPLPLTSSGPSSNDPLAYQAYPRQLPAMTNPDEQRQRQLSVHMPPPHPHAPGFTPTDSSHFMPPPHSLGLSGLPEQLRYGEQAAYGPMRPVYPAQMYYDPNLPSDYSVAPGHPAPPPPPHGAAVYPSIPGRTSVTAYSPQAPIPPFHPTTPPVPQTAWTGSAPFYGSYSVGPGPQGQPPLSDEMAHRQAVPSVYLSHAPTSAWSSPVLSSPFQFFSPFTAAASPQMDRVETMPLAEPWAPSPTGIRPHGRPPFPPGQAPTGPGAHGPPSAGAWNTLSPNATSTVDSKRPSVSTAAEEPAKPVPVRPAPVHDKERKEYHPQPPARRSEWVMWVGNVPGNVAHEELWRFFNTTVPTSAQGAAEGWRGPSSIFLISRSSCAFVNFSSQADLDRAVPFFNGLSLRPWDSRCPRMVCRVRHKDDDLRAGVGAQRGVGMHRSWVEQHKPERKDTGVSPKSSHLELPDGDHSNHDSSSAHKSSASYASTNSSFLAHHFPKRYFILKSLSTQDLEDSVKDGLWRTQRHNQPILDQAFRTSQEVILIFGANRSGEFFGYAKMASASVRRTPERQKARGSFSPNNAKQGSTNLLTVSPGGPGDSPRTLRRHNQHGSTPAPIREEDDGSQQVRSATDPYRRFSYLSPYARAASPGQLDEDEVLRIANLEISEEDGALLRSESLDLMDEITRRASNATLDPNLLRGDRSDSRLWYLSTVEHKSSLQIQVGDRHRKDTLPRRPSEVIAEHAESSPDSADPLAPAFKLEWIKVRPLSFSRTRHLRNPWNGDREVKVSRDGTEVETSVGGQLLAEWSKLELEKEEGDTKSSGGDPSSPSPSG